MNLLKVLNVHSYCVCLILLYFQGGKLFYLEHVRADERTFNYKMQRLLNPPWRFISDGCNLTRDTWRYVDEAGFSDVKQEKFSVEIYSTWKKIAFPDVIRPHILGVATK